MLDAAQWHDKLAIREVIEQYTHSRDIVDPLASEVDSDTARLVFRDNAVRVFGFDEERIDRSLEDLASSAGKSARW